MNADGWLAGKRVDDDTDGLWRIHDNLYDLSKFNHPGSQFWIEMSKGTDITELFESSHPNIEKAKNLLPKYFARHVDPKKARNSSALTFYPDGFYCTLRSRVWEVLKENGGGAASWDMLAFHDLLLLTVLLCIASMVLPVCDEPKYWISIAFVSGFLLSCLGSVGHNFFHHRDNWRMYSWDLTLYSSYEWRITHGYSHHNYPNSVLDFEISAMEPFLYWLPVEKNLFRRTFSFLILQILSCLAMFIQFTSRYIAALLGKKRLRPENLLPVLLFVFLCLLRGIAVLHDAGLLTVVATQLQSSYNPFSWPHVLTDSVCPLLTACIHETFLRLVFMYVCCSWVFHNVSLSAGHHHPDIWHEGDVIAAKELDFGIFQLSAVGDRPGIDANAYVSACCYGQHAIHHLFPTVDQSKLGLLLPVLKQTCEEFFIMDAVDAKPGRDEPSVSDISATRIFLEHRQMSAADGFWGMVHELSRTKASAANAITSYRKHISAEAGSKSKANVTEIPANISRATSTIDGPTKRQTKVASKA